MLKVSLVSYYLFIHQIIAKAEAEAGGGFDSDQLSQMFAKLPSDISKVRILEKKGLKIFQGGRD